MPDRTDLTITDILNGVPVGVKNGIRAQAVRDGFASQDADVKERLAAASNLSDLADAATARTNLGNIKTLTEILALIVGAGYLQAANDLSDVADVPTARINLDVIQRIASAVVGDLVIQTASGELAGAGVKVDDTGATTGELLTAAEIDTRLEEKRRYVFMLSGR